jgi:hypothetical protein
LNWSDNARELDTSESIFGVYQSPWDCKLKSPRFEKYKDLVKSIVGVDLSCIAIL